MKKHEWAKKLYQELKSDYTRIEIDPGPGSSYQDLQLNQTILVITSGGISTSSPSLFWAIHKFIMEHN